jgi:hypothetical protein
VVDRSLNCFAVALTGETGLYVFHYNHQYERLVNWMSILSNIIDYIIAITNSTFYKFNNIIYNSL